jgi:UDP-glucuronate decarboxylase
MSKILVAGGAGFLGSHLCEKLLANGDNVLCLDNLSTGSQLNINSFSNNKNFKFIYHDIIFPIELQVDKIYNLACPASPKNYQLDPIKTIKTNILGSINLLDIAKNNKAQILQASTSEVYGDPAEHPQSESYWGNVNPVGIRSCYDEGKRCSETLFFDYWRTHHLAIKVMRIFNTYGPRMDPNDGRVVSNFIVQALRGEAITIYGDGSQTRSFCYVDDLIDGMIKLMNSSNDITGPINIGNPIEFSMVSLAELILRMVDSSSDIIYLPLPQDDPRQRKPDISLAKNKLDWEPLVSLEDGLKETITYFRKLLQA